jgi:putative Holliday junction resolvase
MQTLKRGKFAADAARLDIIISEQGVGGLVVGLPLNMDGSEGPMAAEARAFGAWLEAGTRLPVAFEDERLSTDEAEAFLRGAGLRPSDRKKLRDSVAAAVILRSVLERGG